MLKNYLKIALRNLWKSKAFSAINIVGLAAGLAVCLLIVLYVVDELNYDRWNPNADRIYRLDADIFFNNTQFNAAVSPKPMAPALVKDYPEVEQMTRINYQGDILVRKGNDNIQDHQAAFADSTFFKVFPVPLIAGDPATALNEPTAIIIDATTARKYFGSTDVVGKTLHIDNSTDCKVTAVMQDIPRQSHFHFHFLRLLRDNYKGASQDWLSNNEYSYILVRPGTPRATIQAHVDKTVYTYLSKQLEGLVHASVKDLEQRGGHFRYPLMPLTRIHLYSDNSYEIEANGNISYVYIFSVIATLILLIACVNFMNLSTARSANRAKEVGIRKVAGSLRIHLITQFLTESVLLSFLSLLLGILIAALLLPVFNDLAGKQIPMEALLSSWFLPASLLLVLIVGILAGSYPAFYLSSFQPIQVLKGKIASGFKGGWLRSSLVVFQFSISIVLIIGTMVIFNQLQYIHNRKIGFSRDQVLVLHNTWNLGDKIKAFREEILKFPGVKNVTISGNLPTSGRGSYGQNGWFQDPSLDAKKAIILADFMVDENFVPTLDMEMAQGRNFSKDFKTDSSGIILNEEAARVMGIKDPARTLMYRPDFRGGDPSKAVAYHIVGIVKDFNYSSMREKVGPMVIEYGENPGSIAVSVRSQNILALLQQIEGKWKAMAPGQPFQHSFMDEDFNKMYNAEQQTGSLFISFAVFAIFIACLGLFGLVTYAAEQRTKEIGIRKVMGARVGTIVAMLSGGFAKLVLIASIISFPLAWWAMDKWLQGFAFRVGIGWWIFALAGVTAMLIALVTVSFQTIRAALANPVKSLKTE